jgi:hypothetical protein
MSRENPGNVENYDAVRPAAMNMSARNVGGGSVFMVFAASMRLFVPRLVCAALDRPAVVRQANRPQ